MSEFPREELCRILRNPEKTHDDVQFIYENIQKLQFFKDFFTEHMAATSMESILALCEGFAYEKAPIGKYVLKKGDTSNNKFYVILSGQVAVVLPDNVFSLTKVDNSLTKVDENNNNTLKNVDQRSIIKLKSAGEIPFIKMKTNDSDGFASDKGRKNDNKGQMSPASSECPSPSIRPIRILRTSTLSEVQVERSPSIRSKRASRRPTFFHRSISLANDGNNEDKLESLISSQLEMVREEEQAPSLMKLGQIIEEEIPFDLEEDYKFEEYANKHGNIVRYLKEGETFGELALQNSSVRSASILCRTDCEFLVGTKQQFEIMFERRDQEKERFFKSSFPLLANIVVSTAGFNYFLSTYKPEVFMKGTYLMNEGRVKKKDAKMIYIIVKGECLVERTLTFEVSSPYNKSQSIAKNVMTVRLAVVGKGSVIGEELLLTRNHYRYSVKVTSDTLHVYAVTKEDFETKNFKEFRDHILGLCRIKNEQRETIFENALREQEAKTQQYKSGNVYCIKNADLQPLLVKPAMHGLSRYMHREQKVVDASESPLASFFMTATPSKKEHSNSPPKTEEKTVYLDTDFSATRILKSMKEKKRPAEASEIFNSRDQSLEAKLAFLDRIPDFTKKNKDFSNPKEFENLRLFNENENAQTKGKRFALKKPEKILVNDSSVDNSNNTTVNQTRATHDTVHWMLKEMGKFKRKHRYSSSQEIEPKQVQMSQLPLMPQIQIQKTEEKGSGVEEAQRNTPAISSAIYSMRKNSTLALENNIKNLKSSTPSITDLQSPKPMTASTPAIKTFYPKGLINAKPLVISKKDTTLSTEASPLTSETQGSAKIKLIQASDIIYQEQERRPRQLGYSTFHKVHTESLLNLKSIEQSDNEESPTNLKYNSFYINTFDLSPENRKNSSQSPEKNQRLHTLGHSQSKSNLRRNKIRCYNPIEERKKFFEHPYIGSQPKVKKISAKNLLVVMSPTSGNSNLLNRK